MKKQNQKSRYDAVRKLANLLDRDDVGVLTVAVLLAALPGDQRRQALMLSHDLQLDKLGVNYGRKS